MESILVSGQAGVMGGPGKSLKTSLAVDLAISLASGGAFLGRFKIAKPVRTIMLSDESAQRGIREVAQRIAKAKGIALANADVLWGFNLPCFNVAADLAQLEETLDKHQPGVAIFDAVYLAMSDSSRPVEPMNLYQIGSALRNVSRVCFAAGATPIFVHQTTKIATRARRDDQAFALDLSDLAYPGVGDYVRQWLLVRHREQYMPGTCRHELLMTVGGSAGRSELLEVSVDEGVPDERLGGRQWAVRVRSAGWYV